MGMSPDPHHVVEPLVDRRVKVTFTNGSERTGVILGCGPEGFQLASGIGGRMLLGYGEVDSIEDLGRPSVAGVP